ncbi:MAG: ATP-binding cassette domain-containing protein [Pseudomonadota bacterium]
MAFDRPVVMAPAVIDLALRSVLLDGAHVLGALDLRVGAGETVAILGPSGIGKTTLLRVMAGLEPQFDGTRTAHGSMAIMFQEPTLLPWRNARDNITIATGHTAPDALLDEVGLAGRGDALPGQLSLGQQRRLALARALALSPDLLLLDEPFVSLDTDLHHDMISLVASVQARHRMATVLVTHDLDEATALATRIITLGGQPAQIVAERANLP